MALRWFGDADVHQNCGVCPACRDGMFYVGFVVI